MKDMYSIFACMHFVQQGFRTILKNSTRPYSCSCDERLNRLWVRHALVSARTCDCTDNLRETKIPFSENKTAMGRINYSSIITITMTLLIEVDS